MAAAGPRLGPLEYWAMRGESDVAKMMLSLGADPNTVSTTGTTPLADAELQGDLEVVRALRGAGRG